MPELPVTPPEPPKSKWYHKTWFVLLMISPVALGPFGLPLLWKSPRFSRGAKLGLTVMTAGWTIWGTVYIVKVVVPAVTNGINQFNSTLQF